MIFNFQVHLWTIYTSSLEKYLFPHFVIQLFVSKLRVEFFIHFEYYPLRDVYFTNTFLILQIISSLCSYFHFTAFYLCTTLIVEFWFCCLALESYPKMLLSKPMSMKISLLFFSTTFVIWCLKVKYLINF